MDSQQNKEKMRRIPTEAYNKGNLSVLDEIVEPNYIEHFPVPPGWPSGLAGLKQFITAFRSAFPDLHYTIEDELVEGDKYVVRTTVQGTQKGEFMGIPATEKKAKWDEIHIATVVNGKLAEHWGVTDRLGMLQQLGIVPTPDQQK